MMHISQMRLELFQQMHLNATEQDWMMIFFFKMPFDIRVELKCILHAKQNTIAYRRRTAKQLNYVQLNEICSEKKKMSVQICVVLFRFVLSSVSFKTGTAFSTNLEKERIIDKERSGVTLNFQQHYYLCAHILSVNLSKWIESNVTSGILCFIDADWSWGACIRCILTSEFRYSVIFTGERIFPRISCDIEKRKWFV